MKRLLLLLGLLPSVALAASPTLTASGGWFRYLLPGIPAAGYVTLANPSDAPVTVIGASSPACGMLMLHRSVDTNGQEQMLAVRSVTVPPHGSFRFSPDGYHMMCMEPRMAVGQTVPVTLDLADHAALSTTFPVRGPSP